MRKLTQLFIFAAALFSVCSYAQPRTAFVHLFEWQWNDIASECENVLGPKGYAAVQVSPPQKSVSSSQWWSRYQPVSYAIEGRSGNRNEFASMVSRCKNAGVDIYVDAVINHMAAGGRYYPDVPYYAEHFHTCYGQIDYGNRWQVQNCDLVGLNDLATEQDYVRTKIANYLNDLTNLGVAGFRFDAAKHIPAGDIAAIKAKLIGNPYIFQEVIGAPGEPIQPSEYTYLADVTEFNFTKSVSHFFKGRGPIKELKNIGTWGGWVASADAVTFVANHDNQRQDTNNTITHKDGDNRNTMAHVFMLGWPYGYPKVMSSYEWHDHDQGPPGHGASSCNGGWLCEHRTPAIANMVAFRNFTADEFRVTNYWDNGNNQIAWGRGGKGFVVINMEGNNLTRTFQTGMPAGRYCDIISGNYNAFNKSCSGNIIDVDNNGNAVITAYYRNGAAIHVGAIVEDCEGIDCCTNCPTEKVETTFSCSNGSTYWGQSVYVIGNQEELGNWNPAHAVKLDASAYPTWTGTIELTQNTDVEWKCLKRDEQNPSNGVVWQGGANNQFNTGTTNEYPTGSF
ncbi:alpha amylase C-terminal domain-containing protein [Saccharophagus degradans]|uniref:carbohydrate-binding module family 20 domain-containing protein n=1 Tax=Saccharophagus degradans TaxID=86304 RepID=UPI001C0964E6|nr:carbohydrate-binding module family 20 domain-containing protein [Saccharophagus degradans]MBU2984610.1 alpha amylase C-terminal domain-containing protein [Saccharophagus degradans]